MGLKLYKEAHKDRWAEMGAANSPLALFHNVNFEILKNDYVVDERIIKKIEIGEIKTDELQYYMDY